MLLKVEFIETELRENMDILNYRYSFIIYRYIVFIVYLYFYKMCNKR